MKLYFSVCIVILISAILMQGCSGSKIETAVGPGTAVGSTEAVEPTGSGDGLARRKLPGFALGMNYAWSNPNGFGNDFSDANWSEHWAAMQSDLDAMQSKGVQIVRWWVFAGLDQAPLWSGTGRGSTVTGLPEHWVEHMAAAADYANSRGIRIYWCLLSFDLALNYNTQTHDDIIDNPAVQASYMENAVKPIIEALKDHEGVMGWDIINEPEWIIRAEDGGDPKHDARRVFSLDQLRSFVQNNAAQIHALGAKQPVSTGSASAKWSGNQYTFWKGLGLDFYDVHWYDWYTAHFDPSRTDVSSLGLDKPVFIGEVMSDPSVQYSGSTLPKNHKALAEGVYKHGYAGYMPWAWTDSENKASDTIVPFFEQMRSDHPELTARK